MNIRGILKKLKSDKIFVQVACLIVSISLWVMVMVDTNPKFEKNFTNVPVSVRNLSVLESSNMAFMNNDKDNLTVNIKVRGYGDQLNNLTKSDFSAYIDVLGFPEGISNANVVVLGPNGVEIESYYPSQIACKIDSVISKVMDVTLNYEGKPANDLYSGEGTANPTSVKISGPRSIVDSAIKAVATVNVEGSAADVVKTVPVRIYDGMNNEIFMSVPVNNVQVSVPIYPTKYVSLIPKITGVPIEGFNVTNVTVNPEKVKIAGPKDVINNIYELRLEDLNVTGSNKDISASKQILDTDGITVVGLNSQIVVTAMIEETIAKEFTYSLDEINFINLKDGLEIVNNADKNAVLTVKVIGNESIINKFTKEDLKINADLSNAKVGMNQVLLKSETDIDVDNIDMSFKTVQVEIENKTQENTQTQEP